MKNHRQRLAELNNVVNNRKRKNTSSSIQLFMAELLVEMVGDMKLVKWIITAVVLIGIGALVTMVISG